MKLLMVLLDGVPVEALLGLSLLFIVLPILAIILLIYFFNKRRKRKQ